MTTRINIMLFLATTHQLLTCTQPFEELRTGQEIPYYKRAAIKVGPHKNTTQAVDPKVFGEKKQ